jgi:RNA-directed DNA polymerase
MDFEIWRKLWRWARRRHQSKAASWIMERYWRPIGRNRWTFCGEAVQGTSSEKPKLLILAKASHTRIVRHCKIIGEAHAFDPAWRDYFAKRKQSRETSSYQPLPVFRDVDTGPSLLGL